uniref:DUF1254 domain-containing protein n=1 Tax=Chromera velia CCMP2878 TaxID=1169474 RepID=A0A0G4GPU1_9ALVE|eukprot:Cvel_22854.t1-p1 / transcript=Cvel_22854.t1 / gene=Cvel_22854 / organism=Chromera_velia_CCMP2878 / gene_product=hypothetical protein / transcript_product=hypothetical protein / location=Cvel_scaffold2292:22411-23874(+) / protein_length=488 / sequence_SO=supercontig / SO=protein_coding / is_pseudo=false
MLFSLAVSFLSAAAGFLFCSAQENPPLFEVTYNGNWPSADEAQELVDELYYQRAIHAYMTMLPALNVIGMRDGSEGAFGKGYNVLPIWKDRMDSRTWVPTPNGDVIYSMSYLDLKETGPLVVAAPPRVIGMFTDFFQRTITDVGTLGPDRGKGGLFLLLPPGYQGHMPAGYFSFKSDTFNVFLFFRTVMPPGGEKGPDPRPAVSLAERTRVYPLWGVEKEIKQMVFPNASGKRVNMMYPTDFAFWEKLKAFVDYEPVECITPELRGVLASIGIIKGEPFTPTERKRELLDKAVRTAPKMIMASRKMGRADGRNMYYTDRQYERAWAGATAEFHQQTYLDIDQRAAFFQYAYSSAPAMVMRTIGAGSKYPVTSRDADGEILNGNNTYSLRLPPDVPATLFWAVTAYNVPDGTMPETSQLLPSKNSMEEREEKEDGSVELFFGPSKPEGVSEENFIQTVSGRDFLVAIRLYGSDIEFFDQTWKPDDLLKQ